MPHASEEMTIALLADHPALMPAVGELRWREWGDEPGREEPAWWTAVTAQEAGRDRLPVTWVAIGAQGEALGAVGLAEYDIEERRDRSPWLVGMIVHEDRRGRGIGGRLVAQLEAWAAARGYTRLWLATGGPAVAFYRKCGWLLHERFARGGEETTVLTRQI